VTLTISDGSHYLVGTLHRAGGDSLAGLIASHNVIV